MSVFTVVIIIWVIFQLIGSLIKKGKQQTPRNFSHPPQLPKSIREVLKEPAKGSWQEQMQQAFTQSSRQLEEEPVRAESIEVTEARSFMDGFVQTEGTQGVEGTQGIEGTSSYKGNYEVETYCDREENLDDRMPEKERIAKGLTFSLEEKNLIQGIVWAEVLGKPRALQPFKVSRP